MHVSCQVIILIRYVEMCSVLGEMMFLKNYNYYYKNHRCDCKIPNNCRGHELVEMPGITKEGLLNVIHEYDGLVVRSRTKVTKEVLDAGSNLKMIGRAGTGVDNIDTGYATKKGVLVVNTPGGNTVSTAELAVSHILALARNIPQAVASLKEGEEGINM